MLVVPIDKDLGAVSPESAPPVIWKRLDFPGHEICHLLAFDDAWKLKGVSVFLYHGDACRLDYEIECNGQWVTRSVRVTGLVGKRSINCDIRRDIDGKWYLNDQVSETVKDCVDIDLNFSPSTNLLPIRRLELAEGEPKRVHAAWLRFPSFSLEPLAQSYTRLGPKQYRYESGVFKAAINVDESGMVVDYGKLWRREIHCL